MGPGALRPSPGLQRQSFWLEKIIESSHNPPRHCSTCPGSGGHRTVKRSWGEGQQAGTAQGCPGCPLPVPWARADTVTASPAHSQHWGNRGCWAGAGRRGDVHRLGVPEAHGALRSLHSVLEKRRIPGPLPPSVSPSGALFPSLSCCHTPGPARCQEQPTQTPWRVCERPGGFPQARTSFGGRWRVRRQRHLRAQILPARDFNCSRDRIS